MKLMKVINCKNLIQMLDPINGTVEEVLIGNLTFPGSRFAEPLFTYDGNTLKLIIAEGVYIFEHEGMLFLKNKKQSFKFNEVTIYKKDGIR